MMKTMTLVKDQICYADHPGKKKPFLNGPLGWVVSWAHKHKIFCVVHG